MGLEAVVNEIREKGRKEVEATRAETRAEVDAILRDAQERAVTVIDLQFAVVALDDDASGNLDRVAHGIAGERPLPGDNRLDHRKVPLVRMDDALLDHLRRSFQQLGERLLLEFGRQRTDSGERGRIDLVKERLLGV